MPKTIHRKEYETLLRLLRTQRLAAGLTQAECSAALGRSQSFISDVERGKRRLDVLELRDLCAVCHASFTAFISLLEKELPVPRIAKRNR